MVINAVIDAPGLAPGELWELLWRRTLVPRWLGDGSVVPIHIGRRLVLSDEAGTWRRGTLTSIVWGSTLQATLGPALGWQAQDGAATLTLFVTETPAGAQVRITETGPYAEARAADIECFWGAVRGRLENLLGLVAKRRDNPRQAVVVIHGIGEQEPGRTLRALVDSGVVAERDSASFVKPDRVSDSFELRTVTFQATEGRVRPTTDVYELYWAHLIRDTTLGQVADWARRLLLRRGVPRPLWPAWLLVWGLILGVAVVLLGQFAGVWDLPRWLAVGSVVVAIAATLWRIVGRGVVINVLGDAARYLSPRPANVAHRQAIRQSGIDLLERLHSDGRYDRIVILGHSLGSVIAYDLVTYAWLRHHASHRRPGRADFKPLVAVDRAIADPATAGDPQDLQHRAWLQIRRNTQPWLITDLVTVGSPLTYADFLMAPSRDEFRAAQRDRVLPTCPPVTSSDGRFQRCTFERSYHSGDARATSRTFVQFDHGAPFAVTRWTNLYFRVRWGGLSGDLVGGPVATQFSPGPTPPVGPPPLGGWVRDVEMEAPVRRFAHTWYWRPGASRAHLEALSSALAMDAGQELLRLATETPAFLVAERVTAAGD